ncbi:GNAT family N-acetyltransferase [Patescibacteria group bacterium]|nr:GNAT family N-acetyltransferase [Patescibacteria group bacterium]MBU1501009.1 GNAT family N-acetyltransferase [Patescibacteria group bacterium]MBU2080639.1 GNAT family N-acetyltransferase [Patescibacteria group bacterium]
MEKHEQPTLSTRKASEADIAVLIDIEKSVQKTRIYSPMVTEHAWKKELAENIVEILKLGDTPVGSIAYEEKSPDHIYISGIIVRTEYQGRGIATNAIKGVLAKYPDAERIDLVTHPDNPALKLYEGLGFTVEERKENYWGDGEPRLVLAKVKENPTP